MAREFKLDLRSVGWILAVLVAAFVFHAWTEFDSESMLEADGYYHMKIARLYWTGECPVFGADFPWAQYSAYHAMRHDWQLLYHLFLVPFTAVGLALGGKLSAVLFAALLVAVVFAVLRAHGSRWAWVFAALLLFASPVFMWRMHLPRPTALYLSFFVVLAFLVARKRILPAMALTVVCLWIYNVPHSILALLAVGVATHTLVDRRPPWKLAGAIVAGMILGVVLHPGFWVWNGSRVELPGGVRIPQNATIQLWRQIQGTVDVATNGDVVEIRGRTVPFRGPVEFAPLDPSEVWREGRILFVLLPCALATLAMRRKRASPAAIVFLGLSAVYFYLALRSGRFMEYWVPITVAASGLVLADGLEGFSFAAHRARPAASRKRAAAIAVVALVALWSVWVAWDNFRISREALHGGQKRFGHNYAGAMAWLEGHTPEGEIVYHAGWDDFAPMFFFNHSNRYLVGFDPYFFYMRDPVRFKLWMDASAGRLSPARTVEAIRSFDSRYVLVSHKDVWLPLMETLMRVPTVEVVYQDDHCTVIDVGTSR